ncbi:MAG: DJ-1/PfpI family protein [Candidatus Eremiobacteraeota bacterium]|nr:DJ-1/PfpI family protein [Candidatus Eremiobacteraeota bacterium]
MPNGRTPPTSIYVMAYDQCDELDVVGPCGVFAAANFFLSQKRSDDDPQPRGKTFTVRVVAVDDSGAVEAQGSAGPLYFVTGIQGLTLGVEPWDGDDLPDLLFVAGGNTEAGTGIRRQAENKAFIGAIARQHTAGKQVVSLCTGVLGLLKAGILRGRRITGHPDVLNELVQSGAHVFNPDWEARVVDDGDLITAGGVTSGIDEALHIVRAFWPDDPQLESDVRDFIDFRYRSPIVGPPSS